MTGRTTRHGWTEVNRKHPCPICGKADWCLWAPDRTAVICNRTRTPEAKPMRGGGFYYRLVEASMGPRIPTPPKRRRRPPKRLASAAVRVLMAGYRLDTAPGDVGRLADRLGVTRESLERLGVAWARPYNAWAFPMRDDRGNPIGIRLRSEDGDKWAVRGSRAGLFAPRGQTPEPPLVIVEGPTDTAAVADLGLTVIGRPSCNGGVDHLVEVCYRVPRKWKSDWYEIVILADRDTAKTGPDGQPFHPGLDGARRLAEELAAIGRPARLLQPPRGTKDARDWITRNGLTRDALLANIAQADYWRP